MVKKNYGSDVLFAPIKFCYHLLHFQRFGEALRGMQDKLVERKFYMNN